MTDIYEDAFVTFAATASSGCTEGLKVSYPRPWHFPQQLSVGRVGDLNGVDQQPLYKRGWTLQEITLSRRVIHFAADRLYFVCRSRKESAYGQYLGSGRALSRLGPAGGQAKRELWWDWVEDYSSRTLTIPEDKLPAFAGLAKKFQQLTGAHPAVGLWMEDIQYGLLWRPAKLGSKYHPRPGIPSWSWASFNGAVLRVDGKLYKEYPKGKPTADIHLDLHWEADDLTSRISTGILHVIGARIGWFKNIRHSLSGARDVLKLLFDYEPPDSAHSGAPVAFVEIFKCKPCGLERWYFLIVQPTREDSQRYTRIGSGYA